MRKTQPSSPKSTSTRLPRADRSKLEPDTDTQPPAATEPAADSEQPAARLTLPLTAEGKVNASRLRESTREALKKALLDPSLAESLGVSSASTSSAEERAIMNQIASGLYDGVSAMMIAIARRAGYSIQHASVLLFTADEKAMLAEPTARVINKHFPDFGGKWRDEILLSFALVNILGAKIILLREGSKVAPTAPPVAEPASIA